MKKISKKIILDIDYNMLENIENNWFKIGLFRYADNATFLKGVDIAVDEDIIDIINEDLPVHVKKGRAFAPIKMLGILKVLLDYYQIENSPFRAYLLRDPANIDNTSLLDLDLVPASMLQSVANKLDIIIPIEFISIYEGTNIQNASRLLPAGAIDDLQLIEEASNTIYSIINKALDRADIKNSLKEGNYFTLNMSGGVILIEEANKNIMETRYDNIVKIRLKESREGNKEDDTGDDKEEY